MSYHPFSSQSVVERRWEPIWYHALPYWRYRPACSNSSFVRQPPLAVVFLVPPCAALLVLVLLAWLRRARGAACRPGVSWPSPLCVGLSGVRGALTKPAVVLVNALPWSVFSALAGGRVLARCWCLLARLTCLLCRKRKKER